MGTEESSTEKLINALDEDVRLCFDAVQAQIEAGKEDKDGSVEADYEFAARQLIRAVFAFFEGLAFSLKMKGYHLCNVRGLPLTEADRLMCAELRYELNDKGEIVEKPALLSLTKNLRYSISLYERATGQLGMFDPSKGWWNDFRKSVVVRDRLTHPKMPDDLDVSPDELITAMDAHNGFLALLSAYREEPIDEENP